MIKEQEGNWVSGWALRDFKDVHPYDRIRVFTIEELEQMIDECIKQKKQDRRTGYAGALKDLKSMIHNPQQNLKSDGGPVVRKDAQGKSSLHEDKPVGDNKDVHPSTQSEQVISSSGSKNGQKRNQLPANRKGCGTFKDKHYCGQTRFIKKYSKNKTFLCPSCRGDK